MRKLFPITLFLSVCFSFAQSQHTINNTIDPESKIGLDALLTAVPGGFNSIRDVVERRNFTNALFASMQSPEVNPNIRITDYKIP